MSANVVVRRATIADLNSIKNFSQQLIKFDSEFDESMDINWPISLDGENFFKSRISESDGVVFLAINNEQIIGCLVGGLVAPHSYRNITLLAEVEEIFILDEFRSHKIGEKLLEVFNEWCQQKNVSRIKVEVSADNFRGIKFYNKNGFKPYNMILEKELI